MNIEVQKSQKKKKMKASVGLELHNSVMVRLCIVVGDSARQWPLENVLERVKVCNHDCG
jgi:hypothetical protein